MINKIELEKKALLTKNEYEYLLNLFTQCTIIEQTNYYFDTKDLLMNKNGITFRIREKNGKYTNTIKKHSGNNVSFEDSNQESDELYTKEFEKMGLELHGFLKTERAIIIKNSFCEIVLDKNTYLSYIDYEIEVEYKEKFEQKSLLIIKYLNELLIMDSVTKRNNDLLYRLGKGKSKSERFFDLLKVKTK